ncbi:hypothetical protein BSKO_07493 [Bryopsis sp. KO-2023]|nr:hypothetical protein BSKO_07493 [Bryopsis sp. KO-2023]
MSSTASEFDDIFLATNSERRPERDCSTARSAADAGVPGDAARKKTAGKKNVFEKAKTALGLAIRKRLKYDSRKQTSTKLAEKGKGEREIDAFSESTQEGGDKWSRQESENILGTADLKEIYRTTEWRSTRTKSATRTLVALEPYSSNLLKETIAEHVSNESFSVAVRDLPQAALSPSMAPLKGAVMVADITGFTALTERLSKHGTAGIELLTKCMNNYFSQVIDLVQKYEGDVVKFAGDSLIVAFCTSVKDGEPKDGGFEEAVASSVACGYDLANRLGEMMMLPNGDVIPTHSLTTHKALSTRSTFLSTGSTRLSEAIARSLKGALKNYIPKSFRKIDLQNESGEVRSLSWTETTGRQASSSEDNSGNSLYITRKTSNSTGSLGYPRDGPQRFLLSLKVIIGAGSFNAFNVGSTKDGGSRWEFFLGDKPHQVEDENGFRPTIQQIAAIEGLAEPGETIVSQEVVTVAGAHFDRYDFPDGSGRVVDVRPVGGMFESQDKATTVPKLTLMPVGLQIQSSKLLRMYLLDSVRDRLEAGHLDFINEVRRLTIVFIGFPHLTKATELKEESSDMDVSEVESSFMLVEDTMSANGGSLLQMRCDEKGFLVVCAFGLPGKGHQNVETRGIQSALSIVKASGNTAVVGVTTGNLLCALVGSRARAEYTVFGDAINLGARLMCKAKDGLGNVLCDEETRVSVGTKTAVFHPLEPLKVKGKSQKLQVYKVHSHRQKRLFRAPSLCRRDILFGREGSTEKLIQLVWTFLETREGGLAVVEGEQFMGRGRLLEEIQERFYRSQLDTWVNARERSRLFFTQGESQRSNAFVPWKSVLHDMLMTQAHEEAKISCDHENVLEVCRQECEGTQADLLEAVAEYVAFQTDEGGAKKGIEFELSDNEGLVQLALLIFKCFTETFGPCVLLLKDVDKFDPASSDLLCQLAHTRNVLLFGTMKPIAPDLEKGSSSWWEASAGTRQKNHILSNVSLKIELSRLNSLEASEIIKYVMQGKKPSTELVEAIVRKAGGLPIYIKQLSMYLNNMGLMEAPLQRVEHELEKGDALASFISKCDSAGHPLMEATDSLTPSSLLILKLAAVVNADITVDLAMGIYPYPTHFDAIETGLLEVEEEGILKRVARSGHAVWNFTSSISRDIIYALIPHEQRRQLHAKLAEVLQRMDGIPTATIAFHWTNSSVELEAIEWRRTLKAISRWEAAADEAMDSNDIRSALGSLEKAARLQEILIDFYARIQEPTDSIVSNMILASAKSTPPTPKTAAVLSRLSSFTSQSSRQNPEVSPQGVSVLLNMPYIDTMKSSSIQRRIAVLCIELSRNSKEKPSDIDGAQLLDAARLHLLHAMHLLGAPSAKDTKTAGKSKPFLKKLFTRATKTAQKPGKFFDYLSDTAKAAYKPPLRRRHSMSYYLLNNSQSCNFALETRRITREEAEAAVQILEMLTMLALELNDVKLMIHCNDLVKFFGGRHVSKSPFAHIQRKLRIYTWKVLLRE